MKKRYSFNKAKHHHSLDGKPLYGTTTALAVIAKPALIPWASNMAVEEIRRHWKLDIPFTKKEREAILELGKNAHRRKKEKGGDVGTNVHKVIEKWIKAQIKKKNWELPKGTTEEARVMIENFINWAQEYKVNFLYSEKKVHSEAHWYGGIVDFVCEIDGKQYVGDIKTSSGIFPEHFLQMGAYDICLQEMGYKKADGYIIVNLQKSGKIRVKKFTDIKKFQDAYLHALNLYKLLKTMKWSNYY